MDIEGCSRNNVKWKRKQGLNSIHRLILNEKGIYLWLGGLRPNVDINFLDDAIMNNVTFFPMLFVLYYLNSFIFSFYMACWSWACREQAVPDFSKSTFLCLQFLLVQRQGTTDMSLDEGCFIEILDNENALLLYQLQIRNSVEKLKMP